MKLRVDFTLFFFLLSLSLFAQNNSINGFTITGNILNQNDKKPVANASVFINNTTIGSQTDNNGSFILYNIKPGKYKLIISAIGFENYSREILVTNSNINLPDITTSPRAIALKEVTIKANNNRDKYFNLFYELFKNEFLGRSDLAKQCKILNPEVLDFDYDEATSTLTVTSSDFLEIENEALGYNIKYLLTEFKLVNKDPKVIHYEGSVLFKEMKGSSAQERRWQQRRQAAYEGSSMHFLRAALNDQLDEEGFRVLRFTEYANLNRPPESVIKAKINRFSGPHFNQKDLMDGPTSPDSLVYWKKKERMPKIIQSLVAYALDKSDIISNTNQSGMFALGCDSDELLIDYDNNRHFIKSSQLNNTSAINYVLNKPTNQELTLVNFVTPYAFFGASGGVVNPNSLVFSGIWARNRVADLLPVDYESAQNKEASANLLPTNDTLLQSNISKFNTFSENHPVEKVYLHLDKPNYNIGDTIWFKAYTVVGGPHQLSELSAILYCELINGKDSVVNRRVLKLITGVVWSDFTLPRSLKPGNYHIRAYTNWMRNAGTEYFYNQAVSIGGLQTVFPTTNQPQKARPDIQFFPEGGELVNGVRSRVAVKSVGANGLGQDIKGTITDNEGNEVAAFETQHLGMGVFALIPQPGKTYKANIVCSDSSKSAIDLPKAQEEGFTLAINNSSDSIYVKVAANDKLFQAKQSSSFYLVAQSGGKVYYTAKSKLGAPVFATKISKSRFPTGIAQFTLFSQDGQPLNERIIFVQNNDALNLALSSSAQSYAPRQKVTINVNTKNPGQIVVPANFSVSVTNESLAPVNENKESTILNNLLLTSDLKGYIEQPNYYFNNENDQTRAALDILMLTQGYRRFEWKQVLNDVKGPIAFQPEKSLEIEGSLKTPSGKPLPNGKITLLAPSANLIIDTVANLNGDFKFADLNLPDTAKIVLRARKANDGKNVAIYVKQQDFLSIIKSGVNDERDIKLTPEMLKNIADYRESLKRDSLKYGIKLNGVTITAKKEHAPDRFNNYGTLLERDFDMARVRDYPSVADALKSLALGVQIGKVFLDGIELYSNNGVVLSAYPISEIQEVRLIDLNAAGPREGILMITTKRYAGTDTTILKGVTVKAKKTNKQPDLSGSANLHGGGNADQVIMGDKISNCIVLSDCLQGRVMGVNFNRDGVPINGRGGGAMSVIVDGAILDGSYLNNLNSNDIYSIEVLRSGIARSIYGTSIEKGGALVITTRRIADPNYLTSVTPAGVITYSFKGYSRARRFYSPKYDGPKTDKQDADLRTTIYWNPLIITDKNGNASFEYFNADTKGTYRIVIEGIDDDGNLGRQVYRYKVE